jgi:glycolate oxidase FAD binding subunit
MAGALGTLGVLVQVSLKVLPVPPADATLLFDLAETSARQQINRWCGQPLPLHASCWDDGVLAVRLRGAQAAVEAAQRQMSGEVMEQNTAERRWQALRDQTLPFFQRTANQALWRIGVPDTAPPLNLGPTLMEWHGAQRWIKLPPEAAPHVREIAARIGGHATLFRGGGEAGPGSDVPVFTPLAPPLARIHAALKKQFDPAGILNPGRLYPAF